MATLPLPSAQQVRDDTQRWLERMVIGLNLCPFAKPVVAQNRLRLVVSEAKNLDAFLDDLDAELDRLAQTQAQELETTLLVHAGLFPDFFVFNDFLNVVDEVIEEHGLVDDIEVVAFHPQLVFEGAEEHSTENLPNRSPYPMLHLLRTASLERAVPDGDTTAIIERNRATVEALGVAGWRARLTAPEGDGAMSGCSEGVDSRGA
jgi:uncharacterized protein